MKTLILFSALLLVLSSCTKTMPVPDPDYNQYYVPDDGYDDGDDGNYPPDDGSDNGDDSDNGSDIDNGDDGGQSGCAINQHHSVTTGSLKTTTTVKPVQ